VAVTESVKLAPLATAVDAAGWIVITGAVTPEPLLLDELEDELELEEEEELELLDELEDELLLDELDELLDVESVTKALSLVTVPPEFETTTE